MQVLVENNDARIDVSIDGNGADTIVMIHGFPLTRAIWDEQSAALAATHRVVRPDLRGMGRSSVPPGPYLMETLAGDVAAILDTIGEDRATIVGHSLGGYVALAFARMYAERVKRLALVCSRLTADDSARATWRNELAHRAEETQKNTEILDAMLPALFASGRPANDALIARVRVIAERNDPRGLAAMLRGMALREPADDIAPALEMPVLVLAGGADAVVPLAEAEAVARAFPNGRLVVANASGHLPMLEEPDVVTAALARFTGE